MAWYKKTHLFVYIILRGSLSGRTSQTLCTVRGNHNRLNVLESLRFPLTVAQAPPPLLIIGRGAWATVRGNHNRLKCFGVIAFGIAKANFQYLDTKEFEISRKSQNFVRLFAQFVSRAAFQNEPHP